MSQTTNLQWTWFFVCFLSFFPSDGPGPRTSTMFVFCPGRLMFSWCVGVFRTVQIKTVPGPRAWTSAEKTRAEEPLQVFRREVEGAVTVVCGSLRFVCSRLKHCKGEICDLSRCFLFLWVLVV